MSYEAFIGLRHLKGRNRSKTVSLLTLMSILGVVVGVWALTVVLSVLSGFGQDLRKKIVESTPNMVVDRHQGELVHAPKICKRLRKIPGVTSCSPFISNEIMLSSSTNTSGVLLRGIGRDASRIRSITKQMREGEFLHLFQPKAIPVPIVQLAPAIRDPWPLLQPGARGGKKEDPFKFPDLSHLFPDKGKKPKRRATSKPSTRRAPAAPKAAARRPASSKPASRPTTKKAAKDDDDDAFALPFGDPPKKKQAKKPKKKPPRVYPGILLGQELARNLSVAVGGIVRAVSPIGGTLTPMGPSPRVRKFRVAGVFYTGMYEYDTKFAFVTLESAQKLFKMKDISTGLELGLKDIYNTRPVQQQVQRSLGGGPYRVRDWIAMNSQLFGALQMEKIAMFLILALIVLVASFNIISTLTMAVLEKAEEIAILKSMGATRGSIMRIFMIEGVTIGVVGTVVGLFLGWRSCLFLKNHPIAMNQDVYYITHLPVQMNGSDFLAVAIAAVIISFLATIYPALQAARLHPVEGLQHE